MNTNSCAIIVVQPSNPRAVISCCDSQLREPNLDQVTPVTQDLQYLIRAYIKKMATAGLLKAEESFPHWEKPGR
jgi:hypothetical protein